MYIYHLFYANRYHLSPNIIDATLSCSIKKHYFLIIGDDKTSWDTYSEIFQNYDFKNYIFSKSLSKLFISVPKEAPIILHGDSYEWMTFLILKQFKNVNWICWGSGTTLNKSVKSYLSYPVKYIIYHCLNSIVTLMTPDRESLSYCFKLKKIETISYYGKKNQILDSWIDNTRCKKGIKQYFTIYLGNNSTCLESYIYIVKTYLNRFSNRDMLVRCMLHYDLDKNQTYYHLVETGKEIFQEQFCLDTDLYNIDEYFQYMSKCDTYICGVDRQTGLGAINACLRLGKKMYLSGNNYNWITSFGAKVFHVKELEYISFEDFITPLSDVEKECNNAIAINMSQNNVANLWEQYYDNISI